MIKFNQAKFRLKTRYASKYKNPYCSNFFSLTVLLKTDGIKAFTKIQGQAFTIRIIEIMIIMMIVMILITMKDVNF